MEEKIYLESLVWDGAAAKLALKKL